MYNHRLLDHFQNPRNVGELPSPAVVVEVKNPVCGDTLRLSVLWESGRVSRVLYKMRGCTASIAAGSVLTELLAGQNAADLASFGKSDIETALGGLPPESHHAATLCADAVRVLLSFPKA